MLFSTWLRKLQLAGLMLIILMHFLIRDDIQLITGAAGHELQLGDSRQSGEDLSIEMPLWKIDPSHEVCCGGCMS